MTADKIPPSDDDHRVLPFRLREAAPHGGPAWRWPATSPQPAAPPDLAKYEGGEIEDDYRHRMLVNLAAFIFTILLAVAGAWLAIKIADMRKGQDCYLSGRRNCTPIDLPALEPK